MLLLDQGLPVSAARNLRQFGWVVDHVSELGLQRATDLEILGHARETGAVCVTLGRIVSYLTRAAGRFAPCRS
ncbi:DUF5615 family PIN-like protein [uncultured Rhodospira sp.]|uniref:DUF5615 family PIN-like protein n=1 Tax=uncultured Rhodospira sp. TaxID=1936189 RepID=UPI00345AB780